MPAKKRIERPRVVIHRADLSRRDIRRREGLPVTSPPRTVLDCSTIVVDDYELEALVSEANFHRVSEVELKEQIALNPNRRGVGRLARILAIEGGPKRTRSTGERAFLRLLRENGFAETFETNANVHGWNVDVLWRDLDFCVELDGWDGHSGRMAFERDRRKRAELSAAGVEVFPVTGRQLARTPGETMRLLRSALTGRSSRD